MVAATAVASGFATRALIPILRRRNMLDRPNERSSHVAPTLRGGGIAPVGVVLLAWTALGLAGSAPPAIVGILAGTVLLAVVCWLDDQRDLSPATRLAAQAAAVAAGLCAVPDTPVLHWLGPEAFFAAVGLSWMWWVNLFNFMDGIDGLAGSEAAAIGGGLLAVGALGSGVDPAAALLAAAVLGAALGFLIWNWAPARVFLGDVGSAPLGYLTGFLLIATAARGRWLAALILPLYFLADATITLARRLLRGEPVWQAHRQHYYQRAVRSGLGHAAVAKRVIAADILLIGCGWAAENGWGLISLATAAALVAVLLAVLAFGR
jgi:UDP-N-acetylmuramyl pentapeptide phosphotransferase/UDP-N-acetylglucosamine-1-phosphate transferase